LKLRRVAQLHGDVITIHTWKPDVEQHHLRPELRGGGDRGVSLVLRANVMTPGVQERRHHVRRVMIVVNDEHTAFHLRLLRLPERDGLADRRFLRQRRQPHGELATLVLALASCSDRATVQGHELLDDGETDAKPALGTRQRALSLNEEIEHIRHQVGGYSDAAILDPHHGRITLAE
jgi:hypothetical protein